MKLIKLTMSNRQFVWINPNQIGHLSVDESYVEYGRTIPKMTRVGVTTHNNGGFKVIETTEQIIKLINENL